MSSRLFPWFFVVAGLLLFVAFSLFSRSLSIGRYTRLFPAWLSMITLCACASTFSTASM